MKGSLKVLLSLNATTFIWFVCGIRPNSFEAYFRPDKVKIFKGNLKDATFLASIGLFGKVRIFETDDGIFDLTDDVLKAFKNQK